MQECHSTNALWDCAGDRVCVHVQVEEVGHGTDALWEGSSEGDVVGCEVLQVL